MSAETRWPLVSCASASTRRRRAAMQGFTGLDDDELLQLDPWLRLAPAACMTWAGIGTVLGSSSVVGALVPFAVAGAVGERHPFDAPYQRWIRHRLGTPSIPAYAAPRRFACGVASVWLAATAWAFHSGATALGRALGTGLVVAAAIPTFSGFCVPSWLWSIGHRVARPAS